MRIELEIGNRGGRRFDGFAFASCGSVVIIRTGEQVEVSEFFGKQVSSFTPMRATNESKGVDRTWKPKGWSGPSFTWRTREIHGGCRKNGRAPSQNFVNNLEGEHPHPVDNSTILENRFWKRGDERNSFLSSFFLFVIRKF